MYISPIPTSPTKSPLLTPVAEYEFVEYRREKLIDEDILASQNKYENLYCLLCPSPRKFSTKAGKALHQKTHLKAYLKKQRAGRTRKPKVFSCKECYETFTSRKLLNEHTEKEHKNQIYCDCCDKNYKDRFDFELQHAISDGRSLAEVEDTTPMTRSQSRLGLRSASVNNSRYFGAYSFYSDYETDVELYRDGVATPSTSLSMSRFLPRKRKKHIDEWIDHYVADDDQCFDTVSMRSISRASSKFYRSRSRITDGSVSPPLDFSSEFYGHGDYLCSDDKCYEFRSSLNEITIHEMKEHKKLALFRCTGCRLRFTTSKNLVQHKEQEHPLDSIECLLCDMQISGVAAIRDHVNLHRGYSAKCDVCSKVFLSKYYLDEHLKDKTKHDSFKKSKASILIRLTSKKKNPNKREFLNVYMLIVYTTTD